jgi:hypothetical protein
MEHAPAGSEDEYLIGPPFDKGGQTGYVGILHSGTNPPCPLL